MITMKICLVPEDALEKNMHLLNQYHLHDVNRKGRRNRLVLL